MSVLVQFVSVITFTAWGLYVWANVKNFGNNPNCNDKFKYVVFFFTVRATAPWLRGIWIAGPVLSAVVLMVLFGYDAMKLFDMRRQAKELKPEEPAQPVETNTITCREGTVTPGTRPHAATGTAEREWYFDISFTLLLCVAPLLSHIIDTHESLLSLAIYSTVMLELTVSGLSYSTDYSLNRVPGAAKCGKGPDTARWVACEDRGTRRRQYRQ
jgi:hypothetical protein